MASFPSLAPYEMIPPPSLTSEQLHAIVRRHQIELDGPIAALPSTGVVHSLWSLGSRWVLRVPKNETMCLGDHRCEAIAIPLVLGVGVRTPALHVFDDSLSIVDVPYSIVTRVHGTDLSTQAFDHPAYAKLGRELAKLHGANLGAVRHEWLRDPTEPSVEDFFGRVVESGLMHSAGVAWITTLCQKLDGFLAHVEPPTVFVHGDVKPDNVMIEPAGDIQLIDWGDAGFADPAYDFQSLPMLSIEVALCGYREVRRDDPTLELRIVRRKLARSLSNLCRSPLAGPSWYRPVAASLTDLLTFAVERRETWESWVGQ